VKTPERGEDTDEKTPESGEDTEEKTPLPVFDARDAEFITNQKLLLRSRKTIFDIIRGAQYMDIKPLLNLGCAIIAIDAIRKRQSLEENLTFLKNRKLAEELILPILEFTMDLEDTLFKVVNNDSSLERGLIFKSRPPLGVSQLSSGSQKEPQLFKLNVSGSVQMLLEAKVSPNCRDDEGKTPLYRAVRAQRTCVTCRSDEDINNSMFEESQSECLRLLLRAKADCTISSKGYKQTPLHVAAIKGRTKTAQMLLRASKDARKLLEAKAQQGLTALHWAAVKGHPNTVQMLLEARANPEAKDEVKGKTPLQLALANVQRRILRRFGRSTDHVVRRPCVSG